MMAVMRKACVAAYGHLFGASRMMRLTREWRALARHEEVIHDLLTMGHVFEPDLDEHGNVLPDPELRERAARRAMTLAILARAEITTEELNEIRKLEGQDGPENDTNVDY